MAGFVLAVLGGILATVVGALLLRVDWVQAVRDGWGKARCKLLKRHTWKLLVGFVGEWDSEFSYTCRYCDAIKTRRN